MLKMKASGLFPE